MGKFWGDYRWGGKSGVLKHESGDISETRTDRGNVTMGAYRNLPMLFRTVPSTTPYGLLFPKIGCLQPHPKLQSLLSQERVKQQITNLAGTFRGPPEQNPIKHFGEKGAWAYPGTA